MRDHLISIERRASAQALSSIPTPTITRTLPTRMPTPFLKPTYTPAPTYDPCLAPEDIVYRIVVERHLREFLTKLEKFQGHRRQGTTGLINAITRGEKLDQTWVAKDKELLNDLSNSASGIKGIGFIPSTFKPVHNNLIELADAIHDMVNVNRALVEDPSEDALDAIAPKVKTVTELAISFGDQVTELCK